MVLNQDGSTVEQVNHYYPFGGVFHQTNEDLQAYKFGGKELDKTYGLDLYDYSARYMEPALGRFTTMDPLAEKYYSISPYAYCANNPVRFVDPTGMDIIMLIWTTNQNRNGHAGIAISNYKEVNVTDSKGNITYENGKPKTKMVADGTYTYRDLWPGKNVDLTDKNATPPATYQKEKMTMDDILNYFPQSRHNEGDSADGVIKLTTNYETDKNVTKELNQKESERNTFNPLIWNCSDYVQTGLKASGANVSGKEEIIKGMSATTPNRLFLDTKSLKNATVLKYPGVNVKHSWLKRRIMH